MLLFLKLKGSNVVKHSSPQKGLVPLSCHIFIIDHHSFHIDTKVMNKIYTPFLTSENILTHFPYHHANTNQPSLCPCESMTNGLICPNTFDMD